MKMDLILGDAQAAIAAQIDLKNARIYIEDGYSGPTGAKTVNNMAGYAANATTMAVDAFVGAVAVYDRFTVVGSTATHVVTAHTETSSNTTSITFTPGLTGTVADNAVITILPHQIEVTIGEGNCNYSESRTLEYKLNRGLLDNVRLGDEVPVDVSLDFVWEEITASSGNPPTVIDAIKKEGEASAWVSSGDDPCEPYCVDIKIVNTPDGCSEVESETVLLQEFRYEKLDFNPKDGTISCTGKCNVTAATVTRA